MLTYISPTKCSTIFARLFNPVRTTTCQRTTWQLDMSNDPELTHFINRYFAEASEFLNLLQPLLTIINWKGKARNLFDAMPENKKSLDLTGFINIFLNLKFTCNSIKQPLNKISPSLVPFIYVPNIGESIIVITITGKFATTYNSISQKQEVIPINYVNGTAYSFTKNYASISY